jgi:hypothetical protein
MQNRGVFRGPAGVGFLHKTSKFWSRCPYRDPTASPSLEVRHSPKHHLGTTGKHQQAPRPHHQGGAERETSLRRRSGAPTTSPLDPSPTHRTPPTPPNPGRHGPEPVEPAAPTADANASAAATSLAPPPPVATSASINTAAASTTGDVRVAMAVVAVALLQLPPHHAPTRAPTRTGLVSGQGAAGSEGSDLRRRGWRPAVVGAAAPTQNRRRGGRGPPPPPGPHPRNSGGSFRR